MNLTTYIVGASLALTGIVYGYFTLKDRAKDAQLEASVLLAKAWEKEFAGAKATADANVAAVARLKADLARQEAIKAKELMAERKRAADLKTALKRIQDAPKSDDGPVAPVLRRELDDVRADGVQPAVGDTPTNGADANPSGAPTDQPSGPSVPTSPPST